MSDVTIIVRQGTATDHPGAEAVIAETFAFHRQSMPEFFSATNTPPPTLAAIEELLRDDRGAWFLAEVEGQIVGFVMISLRRLTQEPSPVPARRAIVESLGVLQAWQRRGIARRLMTAAEAWARQRGAHRIMLNVWEFNDGARTLYETLGYTTLSRNLAKVL